MIATIRPATLEDAPGIAKVHVDSWRTTYKGLIADEFLAALSYERRAQIWSKNLTDPQNDGFLYVAETKPGGMVGFVSAGPARDDDQDYQGELYAIYLLQQAQGQGIGRNLVSTVMREFCRRNFSSMMLWVLKDNLPSRKFYEAVGGAYLRERPIEIGNQVLIEVAYGWKNLASLISTKE
jgi:L-amino acid N-acyltransferase YncA